MNSRTVERVQSWSTVSVRDGYRGLHGLADDDFSGAAVADDTWLFMLNGRVVGVHGGRIEDFEDASFTAYDAPHLSLPLLFSMQEQDGETQATYYTNDTPLSTTDSTLSDANFTGYVELSENVLSGDYYTVYYGGRSMSAAFVGASEELVKGEEAFERADDEVGLYEVVNVDVEVTDVPEPEDADPADADSTGAAAGGAAAASTEGTDGESPSDPDAEPGQDAEDAAPTADERSPSETSADSRESPAADAPGTEGAPDAADASTADAAGDRSENSLVDEAESGAATEPSSEAGSERGGADERTGGAPRTDRPDSRSETGSGSGSVDDRPEQVDERPEGGRVAGANPADSGGAEASGGEDRAVFSEEAEWRETTTVPSLDPEKSTVPGEGAASASAQADQQAAETSRSADPQPSPSQSSEQSTESGERAAALREELAAREERIEELRARAESAESGAEDLRAELEEVRAERDSLREEVDSLQAELEAAGGSESGSAAPDDLDPSEALAGTNLFVRYASKADPTLEAVRNPDVDREAVNANLRLEHHTQFDAGDATVAGEPFERFLEGTAAYRFVSWLVRDLPFELAETGHERDLSDVFEAVPEVDRAELDGSVSVRDEDGEEVRSTFDVVLRDRMGNPLLVAELNPERDPVTGDEMESLVRDADAIAADQDSLGGAFYVTASFFEPGALETAEEATGGGGLLSRSEKASYVKTGRKTGFHLCLVEDRNETFHVTVPEL